MGNVHTKCGDCSSNTLDTASTTRFYGQTDRQTDKDQTPIPIEDCTVEHHPSADIMNVTLSLKVLEMACDLFALSVGEIQDGSPKINGALSPTMAVVYTKLIFDSPNTFGENIWKQSNDLFDLSDQEIQKSCLKINRVLSSS